jgi:hypothetical protein
MGRGFPSEGPAPRVPIWTAEEGDDPVLAYTFPLLNIMWSMLIFGGIVLMLFFIIWCFVDNFRRKDHHGLAKAGWTILILFIPVLGALIYIIARPSDA